MNATRIIVAVLSCAAAVAGVRALVGRATGDGTEPRGSLLMVGAHEQVVFDWSRQRCADSNIPDLAARAFRDDRGRVQLILAHYVNRRLVGPRLDALRPDCRVVLGSGENGDPAAFDDRRWIGAVWTPDGRTIAALVHTEYQGQRHAGRCPSGQALRCWYNAITLAISRDGGRSYAEAPAPQNLVATIPSGYVADAGPEGMFEPSNIVRNPGDGFYYAMVRMRRRDDATATSCTIRSRRPADARSWRGWDGRRFDVRFADPYRPRVAPDGHVCAPVSPREIGGMSESLTYNTVLRRFVLVGSTAIETPGARGPAWGFYYSTSQDLVHWSMRRLLMRAVLPWTRRCGEPDAVVYPSLIDPRSPSRTFDTTGRHPYLYFTRIHYRGCGADSPDRDLVRRQVSVG